MKIIIRRLAVCAAIAFASACRDVSGTSTSPVGTFTLSMMDGQLLPASQIPNYAFGPWIVRSTVSFRADGSYVLTQADSAIGRQAKTITETGTWALTTNDTVNMVTRTPGRDSYQAVLSGNTLTRTAYTHLFVFTRN